MRKRIISAFVLAFACSLAITACGASGEAMKEKREKASVNAGEKEQGSKRASYRDRSSVQEKPTRHKFKFRDVYGQTYETYTDPSIPANEYDDRSFVHNGSFLSYKDEGHSSRMGVDVSGHQGSIDWKKVKEAGIDFAIIRIAYRGYGHTGSLNEDSLARKNIKDAEAAGLDVGVYVFSQAINEKEAAEEADYAISILGGRDLDLPVCYDPEHILLKDHSKDPAARTSSVSREQFTRNASAFCDRIKKAGYKPMVYANMLWEAYSLDLSALTDIPVWYADYEKLPQTPYDFDFWQYSNEGVVPGISGACDMDIQIIAGQ